MTMATEKIDNGVVVSIAYVLKVDGQEIERAESTDPIDYLHGASNIVPGLEKALTGHKAGDRVSVTVAPQDGYGAYDKEEVERVARQDIPGAENLKKGDVIEMEDDEGYIYEASVVEVTKDAVVLDFNPPLAGKTLNFDVEVISLREADQEEIAHGHPHSMGMHDDDDWDDDEFEDLDDDDEEYLN
jgi:FKBP-type peptidyl-prolyl cis-trans isomerase SlyD